MEKRILLEKRGREANQIKELNLDNCRSNSIDGLTDEFTALEKLSLINAGLTTLKNFPKLPSLKKLELSDNRISNALNNLLTSPKLTSLNLSGNKIKDFDELKPLASLEKLEILDLFNNEVTMAENYRGNVFKLLPSLKYLDGFDPAENEAPSDEDDEVNGVDSDDDDEDAFCVNGIDIDLKELDILEQRIKAKKAQTAGNAASLVAHVKDDECSNDQIVDELNESIEKKLKLTNDADAELKLQQQSRPASMASIYLVIMAFFSILNQIYYRPTAKNDDEEACDVSGDGADDFEEDEVDDDFEEDEEEVDGDVGLADVYNDDLEEDNSDYNEEGEEDDDVDEDSDDDADETAEKIEGAEGEAESESPARGKKRKHDGEGEGEA